MTSNFNLKANLRNVLGSADSRRMRKAGHLPAIIRIKNGENLNILVNAKDFEHQYFKGNVLTTAVEIDLDGKKISAISNKVELHPVTDRPIHVDFIPFSENEKIKVYAKLNFVNQDKSIGLKKGGFLHVVLRKVPVICSSNAIPESIEIDVANARVGSKIRTSSLNLPEGVELANKDCLIASIIGRGSKDDDQGSEGAEGAAAPAATPAKAGEKKEPAKAPAAAKPAAKK